MMSAPGHRDPRLRAILVESGLFPEVPIRIRLPRAAALAAGAIVFGLFLASPARRVNATAAAPDELPEVAIQPLGDVDHELVQAVAERVQSRFSVAVVELPPRALPEWTFYPPRNRYRGERILSDLDARTDPSFVKVLGLMSRDLSVTNGAIRDWGVLGVANLSHRAGVVSTYRLGGRACGDHLEQRLCSVAIHELGHACGLDHCQTPGCVMNDAHGTLGTVDRSSGEFCERCAQRLGAWLRAPEGPVAIGAASEGN